MVGVVPWVLQQQPLDKQTWVNKKKKKYEIDSSGCLYNDDDKKKRKLHRHRTYLLSDYLQLIVVITYHYY